MLAKAEVRVSVRFTVLAVTLIFIFNHFTVIPDGSCFYARPVSWLADRRLLSPSQPKGQWLFERAHRIQSRGRLGLGLLFSVQPVPIPD